MFKLGDALFMLWSSNTDYAIRYTMIHNSQTDQAAPSVANELLQADLNIVHTFRCHVSAKNAEEVVCAFASDGYKIQLLTLVKDGNILKEKNRRALKMFKNFSGLKMDFDEKILAISGSLFIFSQSEITFEKKLLSGIAVYNLSDQSELISGHINPKEIGLNPTKNNHEVRVFSRHNVSLIAIRGHSGDIEVFELRAPEIIFNNIQEEQLKSQRLVLTSADTQRIKLEKFFQLDQEELDRVKREREKHQGDTSTGKNDGETRTPKDIEDPSVLFSKTFWAILILAGTFGLLFYAFFKKQTQNNSKKDYEMTSTKPHVSSISDNSIFDKTE